jgi:hypothetical protein
MEFNIVTRQFFASGTSSLLRMDAEYAQPSFLNEELQLKTKLKGKRLSASVKEYDGPRVNSSYRTEDALIKYIDIDSVDTEDGFAYAEDIKFIDRPSRTKYVLRAGDILISNVRPNRGAITLISERNIDSLASSGFTLLRESNDSRLSQYYVFTFLKTRFARNQLIRRNRGSMYPAVLAQDIYDIFLPYPSESLHDTIFKQMQEAEILHDSFYHLYAIQNQLLFDYLGNISPPPPSPLEGPLNGISISVRRNSDFSSSSGTQRCDAEFFRCEYEQFNAHLRSKIDTFIIGDFYNATSGRAPGKEIEDIPYFKQGALTNVGVNWSAVQYQPGSRKPARGRIKEGDVLLACTAHEIYYVGRKVDYVRDVPREMEKTNVAVADILIIRSTGRKPHYLSGSYLAAFLRSPWGLHQVQRCIRGVRGGHVYGVDIEKFVRVPIPPEEWLEEFEDISSKIESARNQSKQIIKRNIKTVENWLESCLGK